MSLAERMGTCRRALGASWTTYDLAAELRKPVRTVRDSPRWFRASLLSAYGIALREWDRTPTLATWKLVLLVPPMLLQHTEEKGQAGKTVFSDRFKRFCRGEWIALLVEAAASNRQRQGATKTLDSEALAAQRGAQAEAKVRLREVARARGQLTSLGLTPGTKTPLDELTNPDLRPPRPTAPIPAQLLEQLPAEPLKLDSSKVLEALRSAGRGSAQDLSGTRYEHLRVLLEDEELWNVLVRFLQAFARAKVPEEVAAGVRLGRMTALRKDNGKVRGIVAGSVLRRLASKAVVMQYGQALMAATAPYQFALQTRAGTEALAHLLRYLTDADEDTVVVSLDGIGVFDPRPACSPLCESGFSAKPGTTSPPCAHAVWFAVLLLVGR